MADKTSTAIDWIFASRQFDPAWYRDAFPDVAALKMDPALHYRRYGSRMGRAPNAALAADPEQLQALMLPPPAKGRELLTAHEIALSGAHDRAIHYARRHLPPDLAHTLSVLQANRALAQGDMDGWLAHVNGYLGHFGVATLRLGEGPLLMDRLTTDPVQQIADGPLISVIMSAWNAEKTIGYAIRSVLMQTWRNLELLIVDDVSTDSTWEIIQKFANSDSRIRTFRNSVNVGPYVSRNVAVSQARGEWITGHDADDWAHPERIMRQMKFCAEQKTPVSMSGMVRMAENGQFVRLNKTGGFVHDGACRSAFISMLIEATYFHDLLGFWDPVRVGGDSELLGRIEHLRRKPVPALPTLTMFCLDNPEGLTNHPTLGYSETVGVSPHARAYIDAFRTYHKGMDRFTSRIPSRSAPIRYPVPPEMVNAPGVTDLLFKTYQESDVPAEVDIAAEVSIATHLPFTGGSSSSTLDELAFLDQHIRSISLINCPVDNELGFPIYNRFTPWKDRITNWSRLGQLKTKVFICRHPRVIVSHAFRHIAPRIRAEDTFIVVNNSHLRATGEPVYDRGMLISMAKQLNTDSLTFCPISPAIRAELEEYRLQSGDDFVLSETDWTPTFDLSLYRHDPRARMAPPYRIGRHSRDGAEKWHEDPESLRQIFPASGDFRISILGGAARARDILGDLPGNWAVHEFGSLEPYDYLRDLDAFVYFPNTGLVEGFGRTIAEAMLAAVPVILPRSFEPTFGPLPIYAAPEQVAQIVRTLAQDDAARIAYLAEVQEVAIQRFSSSAIARRLAATALDIGPGPQGNGRLALSADALDFKRRIEEAAA